MGRKSTKENKTIFQASREAAGLTRADASEALFVSEDRIEKIESERSPARPEEVCDMAKAYDDPTLCNAYCANLCPIGKLHVPEVKDKELAQITLEILNSINAMHGDRDKLIALGVDDTLPADNLDDLIEMTVKLERLSRSVDSLKLWITKKIKQ